MASTWIGVEAGAAEHHWQCMIGVCLQKVSE